MRAGLAAALAAIAWSWVGCGGTAEVQFGTQRIALQPAEEHRARVTARVVERLLVPAQLEPWEVRLEGFELTAETAPAATGIFAAKGGEGRVIAPVTFDRASVDRIAVTLRAPRAVVLHARLLREGRVVGRTRGSARTEPRAGVQIVELELPSDVGADRCDALALVLRSYHGQWTLLGVDLVQHPPAMRLPQSVDGPELIAIGSESRLGLGLSSRAPLRGRFRVPPNGVLSLSFGRPEVVQPPAAHAELCVRVGADLERTLPLDDTGWSDVRLDLADLAGKETTLELELVSDDPGEVFCAVGTPSIAPRLASPPTVLLVTSDTHRFDHLGSSRRGVDVHTPTLDELAATGLTFENCFSSTNVTQPSHVALMTGTSPRDTGVIDNDRRGLSRDAPTLAERFQNAGFRTFAVVSVEHLRDDHSGLGQGFDRMWAPAEPTSDAETSIGVLERWMEDEVGPLFVWLHVFDAHAPYAVPEDLADLHYPADRDPGDPALPEPDFPQPRGLPVVRDAEYPRAMYRAEVSYLDRELGRILGLERVRGGIVAFTADHGESLGEHDIWWDHHGLYAQTIHIPLILRWPGGPEGARESRPAQHLDIGRTLLDLAGLETEAFAGTSLVGAEVAGAPRFALSAYGLLAAVTVGSKHLIMTLRAYPERRNGEAPAPLHAVELFDLELDPACEHDLAHTDPETTARLRAALVEWLLAAAPSGWSSGETADDEMLRRLAELGYADHGWNTDQVALFDPECECDNCAHFD